MAGHLTLGIQARQLRVVQEVAEELEVEIGRWDCADA